MAPYKASLSHEITVGFHGVDDIIQELSWFGNGFCVKKRFKSDYITLFEVVIAPSILPNYRLRVKLSILWKFYAKMQRIPNLIKCLGIH